MSQGDAFSRLHPAVNCLYFALVLVLAMFLMHPASLLISLGCALAYQITLRGVRAVGMALGYLLPMALLAAVLNAAFNHGGTTVLFRLPSGNPVTLESVLYGLAAAAMLAAAVSWFACYSVVMTSDKFVYLFGRVIPSLPLVLSMTLRFVPRFTAQFRAVREVRQCMNRGLPDGGRVGRIKNAAAILSTMTSWTLENAVETADSMKSRGYGLPGRTAFSVYTFDRRSRGMLVWLCLCGGYLFCAWGLGGLAWQYYPGVQGAGVSALGLGALLAQLALGLTPIIYNRREARAWKKSWNSVG